jgi:hypothetical protein
MPEDKQKSTKGLDAVKRAGAQARAKRRGAEEKKPAARPRPKAERPPKADETSIASVAQRTIAAAGRELVKFPKIANHPVIQVARGILGDTDRGVLGEKPKRGKK